MALLDVLRECGSLIVFTVGRDHARFARRDDFEPLHEIGLPCMCTENDKERPRERGSPRRYKRKENFKVNGYGMEKRFSYSSCSSLWSPSNRTRTPLLAMPAALLLAFCLVVEEKALERTQIPSCNPLSPLG